MDRISKNKKFCHHVSDQEGKPEELSCKTIPPPNEETDSPISGFKKFETGGAFCISDQKTGENGNTPAGNLRCPEWDKQYDMSLKDFKRSLKRKKHATKKISDLSEDKVSDSSPAIEIGTRKNAKTSCQTDQIKVYKRSKVLRSVGHVKTAESLVLSEGQIPSKSNIKIQENSVKSESDKQTTGDLKGLNSKRKEKKPAEEQPEDVRPIKEKSRFCFGIQDNRLGKNYIGRSKPCATTIAWLEEELDALWIGVRRHGAGNWDAMLADPMLKCLHPRTPESLSEKWKIERHKILDLENFQASRHAAVKTHVYKKTAPAGCYDLPMRPSGFLKVYKPRKSLSRPLVIGEPVKFPSEFHQSDLSQKKKKCLETPRENFQASRHAAVKTHVYKKTAPAGCYDLPTRPSGFLKVYKPRKSLSRPLVIGEPVKFPSEFHQSDLSQKKKKCLETPRENFQASRHAAVKTHVYKKTVPAGCYDLPTRPSGFLKVYKPRKSLSRPLVIGEPVKFSSEFHQNDLSQKKKKCLETPRENFQASRHAAAKTHVYKKTAPAGCYDLPTRPSGFLKVYMPRKSLSRPLVIGEPVKFPSEFHQSDVSQKKKKCLETPREKLLYRGCNAEKEREDSETESELSLKEWCPKKEVSSEGTVSD